MNSSIGIKFLNGGAISLALDEPVVGFAAVTQNALMNLITDSDTDVLFSDRGTSLFLSALQGGIYDLRSANHICNFAASETLFFSREHETADTDDKLNAVQLTPVFLGLQRMDAQAGFQSIDLRTMSYSLPTSN